jgi:hypothetical protein
MSLLVKIVLALSFLCAAPSGLALTPPKPTHQLWDLVMLPNGDMLLRHSHGIFRRGPDDRAWKQVLEAREISELFVHGTELYLEGYSGLHVSTDGGITWVLRDQHWIDSIGDDGTLYGCGKPGPEASKDQGRSWQALSKAPVVPRDHPLWCARGDYKARHGEQEYVLDRERALYYRSSLREPWVRRPLEQQFPAGSILKELHVDRHGVVYVNILNVGPKATWRQQIYLSRDQGQHWEALTWNASPVLPVAPEMWGIWNDTLLMTCKKPEPDEYGTHLCVASDSSPNSIRIKERTPGMASDGHLTVAPDGSIYAVDMYRVERLGPGEEQWQPLGLEGVPDAFGNPRK